MAVSKSRILLTSNTFRTFSNASSSKSTSVVAKPVTAVTIEETKTTPGAKSGTTESMMPWEGWFSSFLKSKLGDKYQPFRDFWTFRPDDIHGLEQAPRPKTEVPITDDGKTAKYRYPSPGSQDPVNLPTYDKGHIREDPYNIAYYPTDTPRMYNDPGATSPELEKAKLAMLESDDPRVKEAMATIEAGPQSSPGNKGRFATGQSDYDPTGLRATMSANHESMHAELAKHLPNHLPTYEWKVREDEIIAWHEERGLPVPIGDTSASFIPIEGRIARW